MFDDDYLRRLILRPRMIKTGDWSIYDLVKYLVAVQATLSPEELERLRLTAAFPSIVLVACDSNFQILLVTHSRPSYCLT